MENEVLENEAQLIEATPINLLDQAQIDTQIATAHRYPRSFKLFKNRALSLATIDQETAASCFYVLPRAKKNIEGESVRLAEIVGSSWGNMHYDARIVAEEEKFITAQGMARDLEYNVTVTIEVRRRITDKYNKRYNDDMINTTANAACSIALRNAIFRVVPKALVRPIYLAAKKLAVGDAQTLSSRREQVVERLIKMGVMKERIFAAVGVNGIEDVDLIILEKLIGLGTAIKDGEIKADEAFPPVQPVEEPNAKNRTEKLAHKLKTQTEEKPEREPGEEG